MLPSKSTPILAFPREGGRETYRPNLHEYRTTATAVARLRLETPARIGMENQRSAEAMIARLSRSESGVIRTADYPPADPPVCPMEMRLTGLIIFQPE